MLKQAGDVMKISRNPKLFRMEFLIQITKYRVSIKRDQTCPVSAESHLEPPVSIERNHLRETSMCWNLRPRGGALPEIKSRARDKKKPQIMLERVHFIKL